MGVVVVTSCMGADDLIERASEAEGVEVVDTGHDLWPKAIRAVKEVVVRGETFRPEACIEDNMLHFWGLNMGREPYDAVFGPLRKLGVYETESF